MNLRHALLHFLLWKKQYFASYFLLIAFCSLYYNFSPVKHPFLDMACLIVSFIYCCLGLRSDTYSWKYFQALPISKRELFHIHILNQFLVLLPILIWVLAFFSYVMDLFGVPYKGMNLALFGGTISFYAGVSLFTGIAAFYHLFESIRAPFAKTSGFIPFLQSMRDAIYKTIGYGAAAVVSVVILVLISHLISRLSESLATVFLILSISSAFIGAYYWYVFRRWMREELSYTKINFRAWRDLPIMIAILLTINMTMRFFSKSSPAFYGRSEVLENIHNNDTEFFSRIQNQKLLNQPSNTGMTPLMAAAYVGHSDFFRKLSKAGASRKGTVNYPKNKLVHGNNILMLAIAGRNPEIVKSVLETEDANSTNGQFSALHLASYYCSPEIADLLLEKGARINELNSKGRTALHIASRDNCLPVVVSLLEAGADPMIKDKKGKLARDYSPVKDRNRIGYYLEKKMRSPAGK